MQAASRTGSFFAGHAALARGAAPAPTCASQTGTGWTQVPTPSPGRLAELVSVAMVPSCRAWAVGDYSGTTLIESRDGTAWQQQPSLSPGSGSNMLRGVDATSAASAWAVGIHSDVENYLTLALHCC